MTEIETPSVSKLATAKSVTKFIARRATSGLVVTLAHQNINTDGFSRTAKCSVYIGAYLVGAVVADKAADHAEKMFDDVVEAVTEIKKAVNPDTETETPNQ